MLAVENSASKVIDQLLGKFVQEEIMTKSDFEVRINAMMDRHEARVDAIMDKHSSHIDGKFQNIDVRFQNIDVKFQNIDFKFQNVTSQIQELETRMDRQFLKIDHRYNWIIGLIITSVIGLGGIMLKLMNMLPTQ